MKLIIHWKYTNLLIDLLDLFIFSKLNKGSIIQDKYFSVNGDSWFVLDNPPNLIDIHDNEQKLSKNSQKDVEKKFSYKKILHDYNRIYNTVKDLQTWFKN